MKTQRTSIKDKINNNNNLDWKLVNTTCPNQDVKLGPTHKQLTNSMRNTGVTIIENISCELIIVKNVLFFDIENFNCVDIIGIKYIITEIMNIKYVNVKKKVKLQIFAKVKKNIIYIKKDIISIVSRL